MVTSGKGGTGKTSLTAGVGCCLAALGKRVLCVDLDVGLRGLDIILGLDDRAVMDFTDAAAGRCALEDAAAHPEIPGLRLLTAPMALEEVDAQGLCRLVERAAGVFDFVLLDSPAGLGRGFRLARSAARDAIVVSTTDPAALRDVQRCVGELEKHTDSQLLVMNRVRPRVLRRLHTTIDEAMDTAGLPLLGVVPEDRRVLMAAGAGRPLALYSTRSPAARACLNIARRLLGRRVGVGSR